MYSTNMNISVKQTDDFLRNTKAVIKEARLLRLKSVATSRINPYHDDKKNGSRPTMKNISNKNINVAPSKLDKRSQKKTICKQSEEISSIIHELKQVTQSIVADMDKNNKSQSQLRSIKSFFEASSILLTSFEDEQPRQEELTLEEEEGRIMDQRRKVQRRRSSSSWCSSLSSTSSVRFDLSRNETFHF